MKNKVLYSDEKKIIRINVYTYGQGVKTCVYDKGGSLINVNNTFKKWIIVEDKNGTKYPEIKKETCPSLDFSPEYKEIFPSHSLLKQSNK